jgi:DNA-binding HxlR family transcriptional regulator
MMPQWKMQVLFCINDGIDRFSLIREHHPTLSDQTLSKRLKELVDEDFIDKEIDRNTVPVTITYRIKAKARELIILIPAICRWSDKWLENQCV